MARAWARVAFPLPLAVSGRPQPPEKRETGACAPANYAMNPTARRRTASLASCLSARPASRFLPMWDDEATPPREPPDERECVRLELVGLASEVATLATRIDEALNDTVDPRVYEFDGRSGVLSRRAWSLLGPDTDFAGMSDDTLRTVVSGLREDQRRMLQLRREVERLLASWSRL